MKKVIAAVAAAGVLVAGAFVASSVATGPAVAQTTDTTLQETERPERPQKGDIFGEVLDGLVENGTIDETQADAIKEAFQDKRDELVEEFGDRRHKRPGARFGFLRGLLADDVITEDEIAELPEDHPLRTGESPLAELLEDDGQITSEELDAFVEENRPQRGERGAEQQEDAQESVAS